PARWRKACRRSLRGPRSSRGSTPAKASNCDDQAARSSLSIRHPCAVARLAELRAELSDPLPYRLRRKPHRRQCSTELRIASGLLHRPFRESLRVLGKKVLQRVGSEGRQGALVTRTECIDDLTN